jgi:DNA/RNA-binding domain of Phe-tRNA-synthetase-like protein
MLEIKVKLPEIFVCTGEVYGVSVKRSESRTLELFNKVIEDVRKEYDVHNLKNHPVVRAYRDFYWKIGIDPTKQRPSSEALLRRGLKGKIPIINNVVDAGNIASMETLIPIGLYDIDLISGDLELRFAKRGEIFEPIGGKTEELNENQIVLSDRKRIIHVYPYRDSRHTMIRGETKNVLIIACGVPNVTKEIVLSACKKASNYITLLAGGDPEECVMRFR